MHLLVKFVIFKKKVKTIKIKHIPKSFYFIDEQGNFYTTRLNKIEIPISIKKSDLSRYFINKRGDFYAITTNKIEIPTEIKEIPNFPGYFVDVYGNFYNNFKGYLKLIGRKNKRKNYRHLRLFKNGKKYDKLMCWIMLETFVSPRPEGMVACHGIKGKLDDSLNNLYWGTFQQNMQDKIRDGTSNRGKCYNQNPKEGWKNSKLTSKDILEIRKLYDLPTSQVKLAKLFKVSQHTIHSIVKRKTWNWI